MRMQQLVNIIISIQTQCRFRCNVQWCMSLVLRTVAIQK